MSYLVKSTVLSRQWGTSRVTCIRGLEGPPLSSGILPIITSQWVSGVSKSTRLCVTGALVSGNPERAYYVCRATRACEMGNACVRAK